MKLPDFVRRLEEALYRTARSKDEYQDANTLEGRLQAVARRMVARNPQAAAGGGQQGVAAQQHQQQGYMQAPNGHMPVGGPSNGYPQQQQAYGQQGGMQQGRQQSGGQGGGGMMPTPGTDFARQQSGGQMIPSGAAGGQRPMQGAQGGAQQAQQQRYGGMVPVGGAGMQQGMVPMGPQGAQQKGGQQPGMQGEQQSQGQSGGQSQAGAGAQGIDQRAVKIQQQRALVQKQQRWLLFLRHASKCQAPEGQCPVTPHCGVARKLWHHVLKCRDPKCEYPRCVPSRELLSHHQRCREQRCVVCAPVREALLRRQQQQQQLQMQQQQQQQQQMQQQGVVPGQHPQAQQMRQPMGGQGQMARGPSGGVPVQQAQSQQLGQQSWVPQGGSMMVPTNNGMPGQGMMQGMGPGGVPVQPPGFKLEGAPAPPAKTSGSRPAKRRKTTPAAGKAAAGAGAAGAGALTKQNSKSKDVKKEKEMAASIIDTFHASDIEALLESLRRERVEIEARAKPAKGAAAAAPKPPAAPGGPVSDNTCHLCLAERMTFEPPLLYCTGCAVRIKRDQQYLTPAQKMSDSMGQAVRYVWCTGCIKLANGQPLKIDNGRTIPRNQLVKRTNSEDVEESWVQCDKCNRWQHQVCALFNDAANRQADGDQEYTCPACRLDALKKAEGPSKSKAGMAKAAKIVKAGGKWKSAADLPRCKLSDFLEARMAKALRADREQRAAKEGKSVEDVPEANPLTIRMVSNVAKTFEVKAKFKEWFPEMAAEPPKKGGQSHELPYQSKVLLMSQKIEGIDVIIFAAYLQEYGDNCPEPNRRRVYLSYLDSVKYFRPNIKSAKGEPLRTMVYQELLQGYLQYVKELGFVHMYIWACPPVSGEDYILYCHPGYQKVPKPKALREWYIRMLEKSKAEGVVLSLTNLYDTYWANGREAARASELPYYDGDYLPGAAEDMILKAEEAAAAEAAAAKKGRGGKKGSRKAAAGEGADGAAGGSSKTRRGAADLVPQSEQQRKKLMATIGDTIKSMKEDFILVHLAPLCHCCRRYQTSGTVYVAQATKKEEITLCAECHEREGALLPQERYAYNRGVWKSDGSCTAVATPVPKCYPPKAEPDKPMTSEFFDARQQYLSLCQGNHYQFDQLRRAKHSSMMTLYHLHNPHVAAFAASCNICSAEIQPGDGFRCTKCADFDLCASCHAQGKHPHPMIAASKGGREEERERRERMLAHMQRTMQLLVHASACRDGNCPSTNCNKVKMLFHHGVNCQVRVTGGCQTCKRMWALLHLHARQCQQTQCPVPRCRDLKATVRRAQQQMEDRRRNAVLAHYRRESAGQ